MSTPGTSDTDGELLKALGYDQQFDRRMSLWSNFALGFLYLSPLVGVVSLFALGLSTAGPPSIWWIVVVGVGQLLVALVFGEVVSQYPLAGGVYQWARRLRGKRYAWLTTWLYISGLTIGITSTALFSTSFVGSLFGFDTTRTTTLLCALAVTALALALNCTNTGTLSRVSSFALGAELLGVLAVGLFLLLFHRENSYSVLFDGMGAGDGSYARAFVAAAIVGLFLFYGFEACGEVAEEVPDPALRIPRAMWLTVVVGGGSAILSFLGYLLAADDLPAIVAGKVDDPIPAILRSSLGSVGTKVFLVVALTSFLAGVMGQQAAASRLLYSFGRDDMLPAAGWLARIHPRRHVPVRALVVVCIPPLAPVRLRLLLARLAPADRRLPDPRGLRGLPARPCWRPCCSGCVAGDRRDAGASGAWACQSTSRRWPTASSGWCCSPSPARGTSASATGGSR